MRLIAANSAFFQTFEIDPETSHGVGLFDLDEQQWDIPVLRNLLTVTMPDQPQISAFEFDRDVASLGRRTLVMSASTVAYGGSSPPNTLLAFRDVTEARHATAEKQALLERTEKLLDQQRILFDEMQHRVANSLQIIASILLLKARAVTSEDSRRHLEDAHRRVMSVATVQNYLHLTDGVEEIEVAAYLRKLCEGLAKSIVLDSRPIIIDVNATESAIPSRSAVSLGLIVTELVINAIKYAFPVHTGSERVLVSFEMQEADWRLVVSDNGVGKNATAKPAEPGSGLGSLIIEALAKQLDARVQTVSSDKGMSVTVAHTTFHSSTSTAA
ncbi:sensor histidine kinase [Rhizobium sp. C4]|uniref:sensor histidine kinase n=1 Tax=Rhizobium sp. C4 TaxID=1349800 RepID=UPI001E60AB2F|nr:sensor histidine kinase [Rhizobium sp. C4]